MTWFMNKQQYSPKIFVIIFSRNSFIFFSNLKITRKFPCYHELPWNDSSKPTYPHLVPQQWLDLPVHSSHIANESDTNKVPYIKYIKWAIPCKHTSLAEAFWSVGCAHFWKAKTRKLVASNTRFFSVECIAQKRGHSGRRQCKWE